LEAKIFEKRLSIFEKNNQHINIDKNIALDESVKNTILPCTPLFGKSGL
jgi:hypothetical protein